MNYDAILIVGHGSVDAKGAAEIAGIAPLVRSLVGDDVQVEVGFLELSEPPAMEVVQAMVSAGARRIVVVPLMLGPAGHARSDVPAIVLGAREAYPGTSFVYAEPLGNDFALLELARDALGAAGAFGKPLAVFFRGASEPAANAQACEIARMLAELNGSRELFVGFSGITWPSVPVALGQAAAAGVSELATFSWFLATGILVERIERALASFAGEAGVALYRAGHLGVGSQVARLVLQRAEAAASGQVLTPCDICSYRRPFPGLEERVGSPRGVGHSHLAAEHRHAHHGEAQGH
ncbi:MAG: sirohydrochlorin chelatase [Actinomycetota bacterium]|nr:sirohydrochlorin chelatase [Actinomycetota bacterium]